MVKKEKTFLQKMFASGTSDTVSSKRVTMFLAMVMLCGLSIASALGFSCDSAYIYVFGGLVGAEGGLSTIEKCSRSINEAKVAVAKAEFVDKNGNGIDDTEEETGC